METAQYRIAKLENAIAEIKRLVYDMPSGIDEKADPLNTSPDDMEGHIGGLIWQICNRVLPDEEQGEQGGLGPDACGIVGG